MAVPKRKTSKCKKGMRRGSDAHKREAPGVWSCPQCGAAQQPHHVCPSCGFYRNRQVVTVKAD